MINLMNKYGIKYVEVIIVKYVHVFILKYVHVFLVKYVQVIIVICMHVRKLCESIYCKVFVYSY